MSQEPKTSSKTGAGKGLALLVVVALVAAAVLAVKLYQRRQALEETTVTAPEAQAPAGQQSGLPLFAPKAPGQADAAAANNATRPGTPGAQGAAPGAAQEEAHGAASVTMRASGPKSDRVLTPDFMRDLAAYLASAYHPAGTRDNTGNRGMTTMTFKRLNMRYGVNLSGLDVDHADTVAGRREALTHLMSPIVLRLAFDILADPFVEELAAQGAAQKREFRTKTGYEERPISDAQVREMLKLYAALVSDAGRTFRTFAGNPDLVAAMKRYFKEADRVNAAYAAYADREAVGAPRDELDAISKEIKEAIQDREKARDALLSMADRGPHTMLGQGDVADIAAWIYRRLANDTDAINAVGAIASLSGELAEKLASYTYPAAGK
ncbi:hypothetical protein [Desulfocurvus sp. DL9XJH121]